MKFRPCGVLLEREVISEGDVAFIIRSKYKISEKSVVTQDMIFFADSPEVRFDTYMDWQDDHRFLKAVFDTDVREDFARHEIQFGYCKRPTTRNNSIEQAKFEVVNHKYTDLSEPGYGVTVMNDCKYGISVNGSRIAVSLHKGGNHPDVKGDKGMHRAVYSFMPHNCSFGAKAVIQPSYMLNIPHIVSKGIFEAKSLINTDKANIIVESVKPCEEEDRAFILRIYEAEGTRTNCTVKFSEAVKKFTLTNMLEEETSTATDGNIFTTQFRPFEIKTVKAYY
jgi:alpha-mannosidase